MTVKDPTERQGWLQWTAENNKSVAEMLTAANILGLRAIAVDNGFDLRRMRWDICRPVIGHQWITGRHGVLIVVLIPIACCQLSLFDHS